MYFFPTPWWWLDRSSGLNYSSCWQAVIVIMRDTFFFQSTVLVVWPEPSQHLELQLCSCSAWNRGAAAQVSMKYTCGQQEPSLWALPTGKTPQTNSIFPALSSSSFLKPKCIALEVVWGSIKGKGNITCTFSLLLCFLPWSTCGKSPFLIPFLSIKIIHSD